MIRESTIENYLCKQVKLLRGQCIKLGGSVGIPDRMVLLPGRTMIFIEVKTLVGKLTPRQEWWGRTIEQLGFGYEIVRSRESIDKLMEGLR